MGSREYIAEPFGVQEIFVDGWAERTNEGGIFSAIGYRCIRGEKVAVVRITMRTEAARQATQEAMIALDAPLAPTYQRLMS